MGYKKQILIVVAITSLLIGGISLSTGFVLDRYEEEIIEPIGIILLSILLSLLPLFFLKESVYLAWRKFAMVALPIVALLIFLSPAKAPGAFITLGFDREVAAMTFSALFLIISWLIILMKALKNRKSNVSAP